MKRRIISLATALALTGGTLGATGCYGSFALTKKIHTWNGSLGNKWLNTIVFWVLVIVPVYELVALGDAIIFNLIEFWTGSNPLGGGGGSGNAEIRVEAEDTIVVQIGEREYRLRRHDEEHFSVFANGVEIGRGGISEDGSLVLEDLENGRSLEVHKEELALFKKHMGNKKNRPAVVDAEPAPSAQ